MIVTILGVTLIVLILVDVIWTTVSIYGGGFFTNPLIRGMDWIMHTTHRPASQSWLLALSGPATVFLVIVVWTAAIWLGWFLVFSGDPQGLVNSDSGAPANLVERLYYVGFTVSTLGIGDIAPASARAKIITPIAAFSGLLVVTLAITYVLSLVSAVVQKRQLSFSISGLGTSPRELLSNTWNGQSYSGLELPLNSLASLLTQSAEQRLAYPILDNFHNQKPAGSLVLQVAVLDEALTLIMCGVERRQQPNPAILQNIRSAVTHYLDRTVKSRGRVTEAVPEIMPLNRLADTGSSLNSEEDYRTAVAALADRRRLLHQLIRNDGWQWADVEGASGR